MFEIKFQPGNPAAWIVNSSPVFINFVKGTDTLIPTEVTTNYSGHSCDIRVVLKQIESEEENGPFSFILPEGRIQLVLDGTHNGIWGIERNSPLSYTILTDTIENE